MLTLNGNSQFCILSNKGKSFFDEEGFECKKIELINCIMFQQKNYIVFI